MTRAWTRVAWILGLALVLTSVLGLKAYLMLQIPAMVIAAAGGDWLSGSFPDVFSKEFSTAVDRAAATKCAPRKNDPQLVGYFTDNELKWGPDWRSPKGLFAGYFELGQDSPGRQKAIEFLRAFYEEDFAKLPDLIKNVGEAPVYKPEKPLEEDNHAEQLSMF